MGQLVSHHIPIPSTARFDVEDLEEEVDQSLQSLGCQVLIGRRSDANNGSKSAGGQPLKSYTCCYLADLITQQATYLFFRSF